MQNAPKRPIEMRSIKHLIVVLLLFGHTLGRIDLETSPRNENIIVSCSNPNRLPTSEQCLFVRDNCSLSEDTSGIVNYLKLYYCSSTRPLSMGIILLSLVISFVSLAHAASEFLCPNLYAISKMLSLSDNLAGLTLLAFGNGSADIFSTYHALETGSVGLATSELISAALFILTIVVGLISIAKPFKVPKFFFFRDTIFYLLISTIVLCILLMGSINYFTAGALLISYVVYVAFAVYLHSYLSNLARNLSSITQVRSNYSWQSGSEDSVITQFPSIEQLSEEINDEEDIIDDEFTDFLASHPHRSLEERIPIAAGSYALKLLLKQLMKHSSRLVTRKPPSIELSPTDSPSVPQVVQSERFGDTRLDSSDNLLSPSISNPRSIWNHLLPEMYSDQLLLFRIYLLFITPANIIFKLTIPNRTQSNQVCEKLMSLIDLEPDVDSPDSEYEDLPFDFHLDLLLFKTEIVMSAVMASYKFRASSYSWLLSLVLITAACVTIFFMPKSGPELGSNVKQHLAWNRLGSFLGFGTSLIWISIFASEIVSALKGAGAILLVHDDKIGATFFAFGNSIGDLASNLSIARMGMPVMAFSACFGGPLLSICSLGMNSIIVMAHSKSVRIDIQFSNVLKVSLFALIVTLLFLVTIIPKNKWMFDRRIGYILIAWWFTLMSLVVCF